MPPSLPMLCGHTRVTGHYLYFLHYALHSCPRVAGMLRLHCFSFIGICGYLSHRKVDLRRTLDALPALRWTWQLWRALSRYLLYSHPHLYSTTSFFFCSLSYCLFVTIETLVLLSRISIVSYLSIVLIVLCTYSHGRATSI